MVLSTEQSQVRFLAIVLPGLTVSTHILLALSFALPGSDIGRDRALLSLMYNVLAGSASILGLVGAIRLIPGLVSAYTIVHTITLSFVNLALVNIILPLDLQLVNPVIPSLQLDETAICRDIDAGFGWDEEWLLKCSRSFSTVRLCVACIGLFLMIAQWWALVTVRRWGRELRFQRRGSGTDIEKTGILYEGNDFTIGDKPRF
ncbi:hypothetical protein BKA66DRAFT_422721 [Pyrenochaeta sp. MPI-SDFR-AT-0127]|nr:hypothetical protein BKA66DRAFT_422721 [Pyrenochaeta sp. MPI-SDFR-AT-0127]